MSVKKNPIKFGSMQPDIENLLELTPEDFAFASREQKEGFIQERASTTYWKDAWRRLRQNRVAMVALGILVLYLFFAFAGPMLAPYGYDQFISGSENLYPWHYSLKDQRLLDSFSGSYEERLATAVELAELEKGAKLSAIELATLKAKIRTSTPDIEAFKKENGIRLKAFGYSQAELKRIEDGENVFPHIFGTDKYGRDIMVRIMIGTRVSMLIGVCAALLVLLIGATYGSVSGFFGGKVDAVMMRFVEMIYAIPEVLVVLLLSTALKPALVNFQNSGSGFFRNLVGLMGPNLISLFIAFGLLYWVTMARIIRGQILQLKEQEFVTAAKALGASSGRIIKRHLLPNCVGQIVVTTCLQIPAAIFLESFLSFLGVGVSAPMTSLGAMAADALSGVVTYGYRLVIPAIILSIMILAFNLFGDGLRDALDPRLKK
ncbi:MAG: ABC transporter permease [Oscillospiraceae bacterium]|jgi:ABC-type dipeptide/oligopeptide/nickel transport system permease subunit|nr:ABC transporter permease [Oscillospiraceae bacterium]